MELVMTHHYNSILMMIRLNGSGLSGHDYIILAIDTTAN